MISIKLKAIILFYKGFFPISFLISIFCCMMVWQYGLASSFLSIVITKNISYGIIALFINYIQPGRFYFYYNLGLSRYILFFCSFTIDACLLAALLILVAGF